jgi:hypothetical protein
MKIGELRNRFAGEAHRNRELFDHADAHLLLQRAFADAAFIGSGDLDHQRLGSREVDAAAVQAALQSEHLCEVRLAVEVSTHALYLFLGRRGCHRRRRQHQTKDNQNHHQDSETCLHRTGSPSVRGLVIDPGSPNVCERVRDPER